MKKQWKLNKEAPMVFLNKFPEYSKLTLQLLWDRGLDTQKKIDEFFSPDYDQDLHDPFLLKDLKKAIKRIEKVGKEKVALFADYDADGVCGGTIIVEVLKLFKIKPSVYIPNRNLEGYGLNLNAIKKLHNEGIKLIITTDCGITDFKEVQLANKLGIDVLIFDHHEVPEKIPKALAVVNPKQKDCKYPFKFLSGAGVAFKLAQAVAILKGLDSSWEKWLLDLVAISIATDAMPLLGENRTLMKYGLIVLSKTKRIGLVALMEKARINPVCNSHTLKTNLSVETLGFVIGPRINAASRMDHGDLAFKLLNSNNKEKAKEISEKLERQNKQRQQLMKKIFEQARKRVLHGSNKKFILEGDKDWLAGLAGLVAQKLKDEFYLPVFIFQVLPNFCTGSVRSMQEIDVVKVMDRCKSVLFEFGGHPVAAGFKILEKDIDKFRELLDKNISDKKLSSILEIDVEANIKDLNFRVFEEIQRFAPFECGFSTKIKNRNSAPLFLLKEISVLSIRKVGSNGGHLKMYLEKNGKKFDAIGFNLGDFCGKINTGDKIDIVFELITNEWNGSKELQLKIIDLK